MKVSVVRLVTSLVVILSLSGCEEIQKQLQGSRGPSQVISFGFVRAVSCEYEGEFVGGAGYSCVMKNYSSDPRKSDVECASFDAEGRMMGRAQNGAGLTRVVFNGGEERIGRLYFDPKATTAACFDIENSIPPYDELMKWRSDPKLLAAGMVSELAL